MSKIKAENYIVIQGWMVKDLALKNNELLIYAIIYGFSQDGDNKFTGTLQYLADWTGSTKQGVSKNLKSLLEKNLIIKYEKLINGVKVCEYAAVKDGYSTEFNTMQQSCIPPVKQSCIPRTTEFNTYSTMFNGGVKHSLTNNINNIIDYNEKDNIGVYIYKPELQQVHHTPTLKEIKEYCLSEGLKYINPDKFYNHYVSTNWEGVKDWRSKARYWNESDKEKQQNKMQPPKGVFNNYSQHIYSEDEINEIIRRKEDKRRGNNS